MTDDADNLRLRAVEWHRRMQRAEAACAAAHEGRARTSAGSVGRALANAAAHSYRDRAEAAEAERDELRALLAEARCALSEVRAHMHAAGRRPETCHEMSVIDDALRSDR